MNTTTSAWPAGPTPRRAGVSSFGIGGTNVHVVLEESPPAEPSSASRNSLLLVLSARSGSALEAMVDRLHDKLKAHPELPLETLPIRFRPGEKVLPTGP